MGMSGAESTASPEQPPCESIGCSASRLITHLLASGAGAGGATQRDSARRYGDEEREAVRTSAGGFRRHNSSGCTSPLTYHRIVIDGDEGDKDYLKCAEMIAQLIHRRVAYKGLDKGQQEAPFTLDEVRDMVLLAPSSAAPAETSVCNSSFAARAVVIGVTFVDGVFSFEGMQTAVIPWRQYVADVQAVYQAIEFGPCLSTARARLTAQAEKSQLYLLLNAEVEANCDARSRDEGSVQRGCMRVDNALHMNASVTAPVLLEFLTTTMAKQPNTPLFNQAGTAVSLQSFLASAGVSRAEELTIEGLGLHPTLYRNKFVPHDMLNEHASPSAAFGARLLQAVWSTSGPSGGDLCGALLRTQFEENEYKAKKMFATEMLLDLHGHNPDEVQQLAAWTQRQGFNKFTTNRWILNLHRNPPPLHTPNALPATCKSVAAQLHAIFYPLFMATLYPADPRWVDVAYLLDNTGALSVETKPCTRTQKLFVDPVRPESIPYTTPVSDYYFFYYVWANLAVLNALRSRFDLHVLAFNPSVNEQAPAFDQLVGGFLLGDVVYHVSSLAKSWIMQFLYMYCRIGIVMSPLRDNALSVFYFEHPFVKYLHQGMAVSLSTSHPLHFHHRATQPLVEEYATLMKLRSLSATDLRELARNSVLNSSFPEALKQAWLGDHPLQSASAGSDRLPRGGLLQYRLQFRRECLLHEERLLQSVLSAVAARKGDQNALSAHLASIAAVATGVTAPSAAALPALELTQPLRFSNRMNYTDASIVYPRINIYDDNNGDSSGATSSPAATATPTATAALLLQQALSHRERYKNFADVGDTSVEDVFKDANQLHEEKWEFISYYGVFLLSRVGESVAWPVFIPPLREFIQDVEHIRQAVSNGPLRRLALHRLSLLEKKFLLHLSLNLSNEAGAKEEKSWNNRDFFTAHKVDTNVQTSAGTNARTLLEFFVDKARNHGEDVVFEEDQSPVTLRQLLSRYNISVDRITVDELQHQINSHDDLHNIFLSPHNFMQGRYFAELIKQTLQLFQEDAFSFAENRLMLRGASPLEWQLLARWFNQHGMTSSQNRWMISIPRQYRRLWQERRVSNFQELLDNIFHPLWEVSLRPARDAAFHYFLTHVSGFDCVEDESEVDLPLSNVYPHDWRGDLNPPYNFYLYHLWANIASLNKFRASRGLNVFSFRPQCGEQGSMEHLIGGFLLANGINHGVTLAKHPVLEYMYYLSQLGIAMSPLSNTANASAYLENPFPVFFRRGLNVSLATNKPLYFHFTREPLVEEYSIAAKLWLFEFNDLSEIARNSVLQCGFPAAWKTKALGPLHQLRSTLGNDVRKSRVADIRVAFRYEAYHTELNFLNSHLPPLQRIPRAMKVLEEEVAIYKASRSQPAHRPSAEQPNDNSTDCCSTPLSDASTVVYAAHSGRLVGSGAQALEKEIKQMDKELQRLQLLAQQLNSHNSVIATTAIEIRARLKNERLAIMAGLACSESDRSTDAAANGPTALSPLTTPSHNTAPM